MSDYLKLAGACDIARIVLAVDGQNYKTAPYDTDVETILADTAAALRKAHALQEAYTNLGSERDLLLLECETLRGELEAAKAKPCKVVTLCGSSRFIDAMAVCAWLIERDEKAITMGLHLLPCWYCTTPDHLAEFEGVADEMDALHLKKISMSDEIFVVNVNDYIGKSTTREVEFAKALGIPIRWFTHDSIGEQVLAIASLKESK